MITKQVARVVSFDRGGVSVFIEVDGETAAECLAEVEAARAVLLRHVEAEKPAAVEPTLPTFDEWVAANDVTEVYLRTWSGWCNYGGPTRHVPDDVYAALQGGEVASTGWTWYASAADALAALRDALLRLGKIRGDA